METTNLYNIDFLSNYFTSKEFDFINNINFSGKKYDEVIKKETSTRDTIVEFINNLADSSSWMRQSRKLYKNFK